MPSGRAAIAPPVAVYRLSGILVFLFGCGASFGMDRPTRIIGVLSLGVGYFAFRGRLVALVPMGGIGLYCLFLGILGEAATILHGAKNDTAAHTQAGVLFLLVISGVYLFGAWQAFVSRRQLAWLRL